MHKVAKVGLIIAIVFGFGLAGKLGVAQTLQRVSLVNLHVLGVLQDAGYPQVGCFEAECEAAWQNRNLQKGAVSVALVDSKHEQTLLFEASPDLPNQFAHLNRIAPQERYSLDGIFLTHAHIGHYTGLMYFGHEAMGANRIPVFAMPRMRDYLRNNGPWSQLVKYENIALNSLEHQTPVAFDSVIVRPFLVPHRDEYSETVGYEISTDRKTAIFIPDINKWHEWDVDLKDLIKSVDYALLDAAFYADGELPGRDMSKIPHPFVVETMELLNDLPVSERNKVWFIHMNHTNPLLNTESEQAKKVLREGFNIAFEGLRLPL